MSDDLLITTEPELLVTTDAVAENIVLFEQELLIQTVEEIIEVAVAPELLIDTTQTLQVLDETKDTELLEIGVQGPAGPTGPAGATLWWVSEGETIDVPERSQYTVHGEFRCEGTLNVGLNADLRVVA